MRPTSSAPARSGPPKDDALAYVREVFPGKILHFAPLETDEASASDGHEDDVDMSDPDLFPTDPDVADDPGLNDADD